MKLVVPMSLHARAENASRNDGFVMVTMTVKTRVTNRIANRPSARKMHSSVMMEFA